MSTLAALNPPANLIGGAPSHQESRVSSSTNFPRHIQMAQF